MNYWVKYSVFVLHVATKISYFTTAFNTGRFYIHEGAMNLGVPREKAGRAFRYNLFFVPQKRISSAIPNARKKLASQRIKREHKQ